MLIETTVSCLKRQTTESLNFCVTFKPMGVFSSFINVIKQWIEYVLWWCHNFSFLKPCLFIHRTSINLNKKQILENIIAQLLHTRLVLRGGSPCLTCHSSELNTWQTFFIKNVNWFRRKRYYDNHKANKLKVRGQVWIKDI